MPPGLQEGNAREILCQGKIGGTTGTERVNRLGVTVEELAENDRI
jgi:hypothetical protein